MVLGSIRKMIKVNAAITIREAIEEGPVFQCEAEDCGKIFATKRNLTCDYSQDHPGKTRSRSVIPHRRMLQTVMIGQRQQTVTPKQRMENEANQSLPEEDEVR
jgi:hypothetical protein